MTAYTITIRQNDLITYSDTLPTCDGKQSDIIVALTCSVPIATLMASPYNLPWGSSIHAIITSTNAYGTSIDSAAGNGAVILIVPDAPVSFANVEE